MAKKWVVGLGLIFLSLGCNKNQVKQAALPQAQQLNEVASAPQACTHQIPTIQAPILKQEEGTKQQTEFQQAFTEMKQQLAQVKKQLEVVKRQQEEDKRQQKEVQQLIMTEIKICKEQIDRIRQSLITLKVKLKLRLPDLD